MYLKQLYDATIQIKFHIQSWIRHHFFKWRLQSFEFSSIAFTFECYQNFLPISCIVCIDLKLNLTLSRDVRNRGSSLKASETKRLNLLKSSNNCSTYFSESWKKRFKNKMIVTKEGYLQKKKKKKTSNLCGDMADFTPPPIYLGQDFMQSPVIDMCPSKVLHWLPKNSAYNSHSNENRGFF